MAWPRGVPRKPKPQIQDAGPVQEAPQASQQAAKSTGAVDMSQWDDFEYQQNDTNVRTHVPENVVPDGMSYQWITDSIYGQPQPQRRAQFEMTGWRPVPAERHDGMWTPKGTRGEIIVDGLVLMERPAKFTRKARERDQRNAFGQVFAKEQQLRGGQFDGNAFGTTPTPGVRAASKVNKTYEPIDLPEK